MRMLFTTQPGVGQFHPLVPLARALTAAGHEVAFATSRSFGPTIESRGFPAFAAGLDWLCADPVTLFPWYRWRWHPNARWERRQQMKVCYREHPRMVRDLHVLGQTWQPDLLVCDAREHAGPLAAELLGVPHLTAGASFFLRPAQW